MADPSYVAEVKALAKSHPSILDPTITELDDGSFELHFCMKVQGAREGRKNSVRDEEPIKIIFPAAWPMKAPKIRLRGDFCRSIAHINQSLELAPDWVDPCIVDMPLETYIREEGLSGLFNQLQVWLDNVAFDNLREKDGQWEPMRRDGLPIFTIADEAILRAYVSEHSNYQYLYTTKHDHPFHDDGTPFFLVHEKKKCTINAALKNYREIKEAAITLLCWGDQKVVTGDIHPDGYQRLSDLITAADSYGCDKFKRQVDDIARRIARRQSKIVLLIILAVRRPLALSGNLDEEETNIELLPYCCVVEPEELLVGGRTQIFQAKRDAITYPVMLRKKVSAKLLQRIAGLSAPLDRKICFLGCGSLGSKLAMHLGKCGIGHQHLIDSSIVMPHNLARMGVMIDHRWAQVAKVNAVESELLMLGHAPTVSPVNIIDEASEKGGVYLPDDTCLVVDTTASLSVHDALCHYSINPKETRIAQSLFYANGKVAYLAFEGADREIDIEHLKGYFWRHWMLNGGWPGGGLQRVIVGEGCSSLTMTMSDMQASIFSAGIAQKITASLSQPFPDKGALYIGVLDDDKCSVKWNSYEVPPVISTQTDSEWQIDILQEVGAEIEEAVKLAGKNETGGYLLGRVNRSMRRITIGAQLPAPPDSKFSETYFELGTEGAGEALQGAYLKSQKAFLACGTWHSHPKGGDASMVDLAALEKLAHEAIGLPMVSIIWRPGSYLSVVRQKYFNGGEK